MNAKQERQIFEEVRMEWQRLLNKERTAKGRFRHAVERFEFSPNKDSFQQMARLAEEFAKAREKLKAFERS